MVHFGVKLDYIRYLVVSWRMTQSGSKFWPLQRYKFFTIFNIQSGQTELGRNELGHNKLGRIELGHTKLSQSELGHIKLGQSELGQTQLGQQKVTDRLILAIPRHTALFGVHRKTGKRNYCDERHMTRNNFLFSYINNNITGLFRSRWHVGITREKQKQGRLFLRCDNNNAFKKSINAGEPTTDDPELL